MTSMQAPRTRGLFIALLATVLVLTQGFGGTVATPADSAARLSVTSSAGTNKASASGPTTLSVSGSGFQSIDKGFGGIYVVFGYVASSAWQPSKGGKADKDFFYVADSQSKNNKGYQRFVAFPGSSTADSANGGVLSANGTFKLSMVIPGPTFTAASASGGSTTVDCREVQCGIITFGAHGVSNGRNESFQPISFAASASAAQNSGTQNGAARENSTQNSVPTTRTPEGTATQNPGAEGQGSGAAGSQAPGTSKEAQETGAGEPLTAVAAGEPALGLEQQTVIAGRSLGFTGRGFAAGEQVVATLSSGLTAAGPITAGQFGEIAGAVQVPSDMTAGTHKLKLTGAGSGNSVEAEFSVMADSALLPVADKGNQEGMRWAMIAVIATAAVLLLLVLSSLITALTRKGQRKKATSATAAPAQRPATRKQRVKPSRAIKAPAAAQHADPETTALDRLEESPHKEHV